MSHFTVLVKVSKEKLEEAAKQVGTDDQESILEHAVGMALRPYQENNMGDCPEEFLEFRDIEEEYQEEWETEKRERLKNIKTGEIIGTYEIQSKLPYTPEFHKLYNEYGEKYGFICVVDRIKKDHPDIEIYDKTDWEEISISLKDEYPTFDVFMEKYHGYEERDSKTGRYGYWENPNRKWDWWQIGGRWTGMIPVKNGCGARGSVSSLVLLSGGKDGYKDNKNGEPLNGDMALVKNIDIARLDAKTEEEIQEFLKEKAKYEEYVLSHIINKNPYKGDDATYFQFFFPQSIGRYLREWGLKEDDFVVTEKVEGEDKPKFLYYDTQKITEEMVRENSYSFEWGTYAVLDTDGKWYEKGEMGWWGIDSTTPEQVKNHCKNFLDKWIRNEDPETLVAIVDCHI